MKKIITFLVSDRIMRIITAISVIIAIACLVFQLASDFSLLGAIKAVGIGVIMFVIAFLAISSCFIKKEEETEVPGESTA